MGFKNIDINPIATNGPTTMSPTSKDLKAKAFQVSRTNTTSSVEAILPSMASVLEVTIHGSSVSNAGTTATITVTLTNNTGVISTGTVNVLANGATTALVQMTNLPNIEESIVANGDIVVTSVYAETGTASTSGGPWIFDIQYVT
jgi:3-oxoacyl-ACP reductase-like protein